MADATDELIPEDVSGVCLRFLYLRARIRRILRTFAAKHFHHVERRA